MWYVHYYTILLVLIVDCSMAWQRNCTKLKTHDKEIWLSFILSNGIPVVPVGKYNYTSIINIQLYDTIAKTLFQWIAHKILFSDCNTNSYNLIYGIVFP